MSADVLRRAATGLREEWDDGHNPRGTAWHRERDFHLAVADWLDAVGKHMAAGRAKTNPKALAVARAYLGEDA